MSTFITANMMLYLSFTIVYLFHVGYCLIELQSMEIVSCANKFVCHNGKNLRIVLNASTIETTDGVGSITGTITGGQTWSDSHGDWELREALHIDINYQNAVWEYQLENEGIFWTKAEDWCSPYFTPCSSYDNYVECPNKGNMGLGLINGAKCTKYDINNVEKWEASVSIQSTHLNLEWNASNTQHSIWESNAEVSMESAFDRTACFQDLSNEYYVVVPATGYQKYYFISKQYWQDARNNFNLSVQSWRRDFDCNFTWPGWHTIIPFYETDSEYSIFSGGNNVRIPMSSNQLYAWHNGYIPTYYVEVMNALTGECTDLTTYTDSTLNKEGAPTDLTYRVAKLGIVDYFEITMDLDYTQFVQMPTSAPTPNPTGSPTEQPTSTPSNAPSTTTRHPTQYPTTRHPTQSPTDSVIDLFALYEIPAKLEITSTSHLNISSKTVQEDILQSIASGLNYGREYIRLDSADFVTTLSRRRLQTETESLLLGFTVFVTSESEHATYSTKLEETSTYHFILASLNNKIPNLLSIFIASTANNCDIGTKQITVAGEQRCQSICAVNQYYDTSSSSCKDQVEFIRTTSITIDTLGRVKHFGIGVAGWIITLCAIYPIYRYCMNKRMKSEVNKTRKKSKHSVKAPVYSIGSTEDETSSCSETEYNSMGKKFVSSLGGIIKSGKKHDEETESDSSSSDESSSTSTSTSESD